jgi:hypothetical protein
LLSDMKACISTLSKLWKEIGVGTTSSQIYKTLRNVTEEEETIKQNFKKDIGAYYKELQWTPQNLSERFKRSEALSKAD